MLLETAYNPPLTQQAIDEIYHATTRGGVLSVYLDTTPARVKGFGHTLALRDGCKALRSRIAPAERDAFEASVARVERFLQEDFEPRHAGLAAFVSGDGEFFSVVDLPAAPREGVGWDERPQIAQVEEALDEYERVAVVLFDKETARLFTVYLGGIEESVVVRDEVPGKQSTGEWFGLAQTRYARHHEEHVMRHVKHAIRVLMNELRSRPFDRLIIGGPDEAISMLEHHLPRPLKSRLAGTINVEMFAGAARVLQASLAQMELIERREELAAVQSLLEGAGSTHNSLGLEATLGALAEGRVYRLFIANEFRAPGSQCESCGRLIVGEGNCTSCGAGTTAVTDLRESIVRAAIDQGATIETVYGEAAELLAPHGGLGAWVRY